MKETNHDYQYCVMENPHDANLNGSWDSWDEYKKNYLGFNNGNIKDYDDRYHYVFRYDIYKKENNTYTLELCIMLQRKGLYTNLLIHNISQEELDGEIKEWLKDRSKYMKSLWKEVM